MINFLHSISSFRSISYGIKNGSLEDTMKDGANIEG
jgi:hypothetical protein